MAPLMKPSPNASRGYEHHDMVVEHRLTVVEMKVETNERRTEQRFDDHEQRLSSLESIRHWIGEWKPVIIATAIMALGLTGNLSAEWVAVTLKGLLE